MCETPVMLSKKSIAEAMGKCRVKVKAVPEAHQAYLQKERERYQKRKAAGKIPNVANLTTRTQRSLWRKWRNQKRHQRKKAKEQEEACNFTPPSSPEDAGSNVMGQADPVPSTSQTTPQSRQKRAGRKQVRKENRKAYRTIAKQKQSINCLQNKV